MSEIKWDDSFSLHIEAIDQQHKKWLDIYNAMNKLTTVGEQDPNMQSQMDILQAMLDYSRFHFDYEEKYLHQHGYAELVQHSKLHKEFEYLIYQSYVALKEGEGVLNLKLLGIIKGWLLNHILIEDKKYAHAILSPYDAKKICPKKTLDSGGNHLCT
ncbi:MAG: bacteriohemerythrin [Mariprofundus sp.]|nr:bacteriohemerythrin [Mariprofundus sp.]